MRRIVLRAWVLCWLILVWILLWGTVSAANILSGLAVALLITLLLPLPTVPIEGRVHPLSLVRLLRAHLSIKSDLVLALAVNIFNLIPGSIVLEIDQARRMLYMHVIDAGSDRAVNRFYSQVSVVERLLVASFEREADWRPSADKESA
jgi:multicomponent Na+:H+ antiporter subunit E